MAILSQAQLITASNATYYDNTVGGIVPSSVRSLNTDWIESTILVSQTSSLSVATASYALSAGSASYVNLARTASFTPNAIVTASVAASTLTFTKGDGTSFNLVIAQSGSIESASFAQTAATASLASNAVTASYALTSGLAYTASSADQFNVRTALTASGLKYPTADNGAKSFIQTDGAGNLSLQYVDTIWEAFYAGETVSKGTPLYFSGSQGANPVAYAADAADANKMPATVIAGDNLTAGSTYEGIVLGLIEGINLTGYSAGQTVYVAEGGGWSTSLPSGSNSITQVLGIVTKGGSGGKGLVLNPGPAQLPGLQTGYTWVGNGSNRAVAVTGSSLYVTNAVSASFATNANLLDGQDSTAFTTTSSFNSLSSSLSGRVNVIETTYATTGSNTFTGINIFNEVTASYVKALSASIDYLTVIYQTSSIVYSSGSNIFGDNANDTQTLWGTVDIKTGPVKVTGSLSVTGSGIQVTGDIHSTNNVNTFVGRTMIYGGDGVTTGATPRLIISGSDGAFTEIARGSNNINTTAVAGLFAAGQIYASDANYAQQVVGVYTPDTFTNDVENSVKVDVNGITYADWDNGTSFDYVPYMTIAPNLGNNPAPQFTRGLGITGSVNGNVVSASISSNTSSLDFSTANFFTSLVGSNTFFNITNPKAGETVNLLLTTSGAATASFSSNVKQVSGSAYVPTAGSGKVDVLSFISFDGTSVYLANIKNMI